MTVYQLHKILTKAIKIGKGRIRVVVNKPTFTHPLEEDGCVILDVSSITHKFIDAIDDDGGFAVDCKGRQRMFQAFVIEGDSVQK